MRHIYTLVGDLTVGVWLQPRKAAGVFAFNSEQGIDRFFFFFIPCLPGTNPTSRTEQFPLFIYFICIPCFL